jgi:hypothetical protein
VGRAADFDLVLPEETRVRLRAGTATLQRAGTATLRRAGVVGAGLLEAGTVTLARRVLSDTEIDRAVALGRYFGRSGGELGRLAEQAAQAGGALYATAAAVFEEQVGRRVPLGLFNNLYTVPNTHPLPLFHSPF